MEDGELETLVKNEIEWRKTLFTAVHDIQQKQIGQGECIAALKSLPGDMEEFKKIQIAQGIAIGKLDIKSGVWGGIAGMVTAVAILLLAFARGLFKS